MSQLIQKVAPKKFTAQWTEQPDIILTMSFEPLITQYKLSGNFCLLHWQAKPFGLRRWGVYNSPDDSYNPFDWDKLCVKSMPCVLQIDETKVQFPPTAVLCFKDSELLFSDDYGIITHETIKRK